MAVNFIAKISKPIFGLALIFFSMPSTHAQPTLEVKDGNVWINNLDKEVLYTFARYHHSQSDWQNVFPVQLKDAEGNISIVGTYDVMNTSVKFTPRFPFVAGVSYKATFFTEQLSENYNEVYLPKMSSATLTIEFRDEQTENPSARITAIYPSANVLPENLLKFHIQFSNAMTVGEVYQRVKLFDRSNREVEKAFLIVDQEFWDAEMKVVTLLLDPGRIKRGLKANLEMNAPLQKGEIYTLVVDRNWKDINGNVLETEVRKTFRCIDADRQSPSVDHWQIILPQTPDDLLIVKTNESLNMLSLANGIVIKDDRDELIKGVTTILKDETGFSFTPANHWNNLDYVVYINPLMEDLAGNNFNRVFDKDLKTAPSENDAKHSVVIPFRVKMTAK